jgi:hypothetical protein
VNTLAGVILFKVKVRGFVSQFTVGVPLNLYGYTLFDLMKGRRSLKMTHGESHEESPSSSSSKYWPFW